MPLGGYGQRRQQLQFFAQSLAGLTNKKSVSTELSPVAYGLSVSGATFLILELDRSVEGTTQVSNRAQRGDRSHLGH
jgi:hypothetical protein